MSRTDARLGIWLMVGTTLVFAVQDGISRHLAAQYNVYMIVMIRYWFFAAFVIAIAARKKGGLRRAIATRQPTLQAIRGLLLVAEICVTVTAFVLLGLIKTHAIFAAYPLLIAALAGPVLGEEMRWRGWASVGVGFLGVLIILEPGYGVFSPASLIALTAALMFAFYGVLTRFVARRDSAQTSFFWTGTVGAIGMTLVGMWFWQPMRAPDWSWMAVLSMTGVLGHWLLVKCYAVAQASTVQPFAYLQLVFVSIIAVSVFGETLQPHVILGGAVVVGAGLFTLHRAKIRIKDDARNVG